MENNTQALSNGSEALLRAVPGQQVAGLVLVIVLLILLAGAVAGYAAYVAEDRTAAAGGSTPPVRRFIILGIVAAACVPLFLSLVRSGVITEIMTNANGGRVESYLIFLGLCLVAAFSARSFIDSLSRRVLRDLEDVKESQDRVVERVEKTEEIVDDQRAEPALEQDVVETVPPADLPKTSAEEQRILRALAAKTYRTAGGISDETGIDRMEVKDLLRGLSRKRLVAPLLHARADAERWEITPLGRASL